MDLKDIKLEYIREELNQEDLAKNPYDQITKWFNQTLKAEVSYPNAATLTTVSQDGFPSSRIVLIKDFTEEGLTFFTDYTSNKGMDIAYNKNVSILLFWKELDRQIRINGKAVKIDHEESEKYFATRARAAQINAHASNQSAEVTKEELYSRVENLEKEFDGQNVPCPNNWGGYLVSYDKVEIWQGRPNRLHDRFVYEQENGEWITKRLCP